MKILNKKIWIVSMIAGNTNILKGHIPLRFMYVHYARTAYLIIYFNRDFPLQLYNPMLYKVYEITSVINALIQLFKQINVLILNCTLELLKELLKKKIES